MIFKKGQKIVFAGDSVTDDGRARPVKFAKRSRGK